MTLDDIEDKNDTLIVNIPDSKTHKRRRFLILDDVGEPGNIALYRKYLALRPAHTPHRRLFVSYRQGKCSIQAVGIHTFGKIPAKIAGFLHLQNAAEYTGHALRRTSATLLIDGGSGIEDLKRHGGWSSTGVAEGYVAESLENKRKIAKKIQQGQGAFTENSASEIPSTSAFDQTAVADNVNIPNMDVNEKVVLSNIANATENRNNNALNYIPGINFSNVHNTSVGSININFHFNSSNTN